MKKLTTIFGLAAILLTQNAFAESVCEKNAQSYAKGIIAAESKESGIVSSEVINTEENAEAQEVLVSVAVNQTGGRRHVMQVKLDSRRCVLLTLTYVE